MIFFEDPRYYRLGHGSTGKRILNAAGHLFVAHQEDGTRMFNYSEWLGSASSAALGNLYHPGNGHGTGDTARRIGYGFAFDIGYDFYVNSGRRSLVNSSCRSEGNPCHRCGLVSTPHSFQARITITGFEPDLSNFEDARSLLPGPGR